MPKREVHANTCTEKSHVYFAGARTCLPLLGLVASLANCTAAPPAESDIGVQELGAFYERGSNARAEA